MKKFKTEEIKNPAMRQKSSKIVLLFAFIAVAMLLFLTALLHTILSPRDIPSENATYHDRSFRGAIISEDGYALSYSEKTYKAVIRGESIDPDKRDLFITLFSIYSNMPEAVIRHKMTDKKGNFKTGNVTLSRTLHTTVAMQLKSLAYKLKHKDVFRWIKNSRGVDVLYGLDIVENGEKRNFPLKDVMTPILGYTKDILENRYFLPKGIKGLEKHYESLITSQKHGYFKGKRDVVGTIIHDDNSMKVSRIDGMDLHLNIPLALQRRVELMLDAMKTKLEAREILVGVMRSDTGELLTLATTERFNPSHIKQKDIYALNPKFSEYPYEAGSVLKPITMAIALENGVVTPKSVIDTENGKMYIGRHRITDDHKYRTLTAEEVIIHSSNIGISKVSWELTGKQFRDGLLKFGISIPSGIDLSREIRGKLKPTYLLNHKLHRCNTAYGYGMMVNFAQLIKAYAAFNNGGTIKTPRIAAYLESANGKQYILEPTYPDFQAVSPNTAIQIHDMLVRTVAEGTGVKAQYPGLEIGGKTGTAHIVQGGKYHRSYHSSFYGFANDKQGHRYTIGVMVNRPTTKRKKYYASQSAVPTFRNVVQILDNLGYLIPDTEPQEDAEINTDIYTKKPVEKPKPATVVSKTQKPQKPQTSQPLEGLHKSKPNTTHHRETLPAPATEEQESTPPNFDLNEIPEGLF